MADKASSRASSKSAKSTRDDEYGEDIYIPRTIHITLLMKGDPGSIIIVNNKKGQTYWLLLIFFDGHIIMETKWCDQGWVECPLPIDLLFPSDREMLLDKPLIIILRLSGGKPGKDPDPLVHPMNYAGCTIDLMPFIIGVEEVNVKVPLLTPTGSCFGCEIKFYGVVSGPSVEKTNEVPLVLTMIAGHCLPAMKEGSTFIAAIDLKGVKDLAVNFGMSLSNPDIEKLIWASACTGGPMLQSTYMAPNEDMFLPMDLEIERTVECVSQYWNSFKRVLVDPFLLREALETPFFMEVAAVPRTGKIEVRGRYMGVADFRALLCPGQTSLITCIKLDNFDVEALSEDFRPILELPVSSAKSTARSPKVQMPCLDAQGHCPFVVIKFDLQEPPVPKPKITEHFDIIGFPMPESYVPLNDLHIDPPPEDPSVDVTKIRVEMGALAVHKELSTLACRGAVPMNQGIKKTAANRLMARVRTMIKQFYPGECMYIDWQDTVTAHHAASRRAVNASFRPQPPQKHPKAPLAASRAFMAGDVRIATKHIDHNLEADDRHPRILLAKVLRCLEERNDHEAEEWLYKAISSQTRCRYLLWILGAIAFEKGEESFEFAESAFLIAVKGDYSDGIACTIGWAALHVLYHFHGNHHYAFVSAKKMRKSFELERRWKEFYEHWVETSGQDEILWMPSEVSTENPLVLASNFFLCLRCYRFSDLLLNCMESKCATRGSRLNIQTRLTADVYYLRVASLLLRHRADDAMKLTDTGIKMFGPSPMMSQIRATCLMAERGWDKECSMALSEAERFGAKICSALLYAAALNGMKENPDLALQRAARAHKATPCAYTALAIARIYMRKGDMLLAEKWAAGSVKLEPRLADGWVVLAVLALTERAIDKARTMLRTAHQAGPISPDVNHQLNKIMKIVKLSAPADLMTKDLCLCDYLEPQPLNNEVEEDQ